MGSQMAVPAKGIGIDLNHRGSGFGQPVGIIGRADISDNDGGTDFRHQPADGFPQHRGFSGTRRTHDIQYKHFFICKQFPVLLRHGVIDIQNLSNNFNFHNNFPFSEICCDRP